MSQEKPAYRIYVVTHDNKAVDHTWIHLTDLKNTILPEAQESFFRGNVRLTGELKPGQKVGTRPIDEEAAKQGFVSKINILEVYRMTQANYHMLETIVHKSDNSHFQSCQVVKDAYEGRLKELHEKIKQLEQSRDYQLTRVGDSLALYELLQMYVRTHRVEPKGKQNKKK